ncbi:MAG TPA: acyl carrier protein [Anaerolineae bacterium]|nr:acyl carrier protein [Anaerolineae bacterium]
MDVFEELKQMMWKVAGIDPAVVKLESEYRVDLGLDSADLIELLLSIEKTFGVRIDEVETEPVKTMAQFVALVEKKMKLLEAVHT